MNFLKSGIFWKIYLLNLFIILTLVVVMFSTAWINLPEITRQENKMITDDIVLRLKAQAESIGKDILLHAQSLQKNEVFNNGSINEIFKALEDYSNYPFIDSVVVLSATGRVETVYPPELNYLKRSNFSDREDFKKVMSEKDIYFSNLFLGKSNRYGVAVATPIFDRNNNIKYIVNMNIRILENQLFDALFQDYRIGSEGYVFVYDRTGKIISHPNRETGYNLNQGHFFKEIQSKESGYYEGINNEEKPVFVSYQKVPILDWGIAAQIPVSQTNDILNKYKKTLSFTSLIVVLILSFGTALITTKIIKPLHNLYIAVDQVAQGNFEQQIIQQTDQTEIGRLTKRFNEMVTHIKYSRETIDNMLKDLSDLKFALDASSIVAITDSKGVITYINDKFCEISKYTSEELIGKTHVIVNSHFHSKEFFRKMWKTIMSGKVWSGEIKNKAKDGTYYWVKTFIVPFMKDGKPYQYISIRTDITERKQAEMALSESEEKYRLITENMSDLIAVLDPQGYFVYASPSYKLVLGYNPSGIIGKHASEMIHPDDVQNINMRFMEMVQTKENQFIECRYKHLTKEWIYVEANGTPVIDDFGKVTQVIIVLRDISERKNYEHQLQVMAYTDTLTGLPNRRYFIDIMKKHQIKANKNHKLNAVLFMDIDKFKSINDKFGHDVGDDLLKIFSKRVAHCLREMDILSRLAGDEFVILLPNIESIENATKVAERIIGKLQEPFVIQNKPFSITTSIGITISKGEEDFEQVLRRADKAMYEAKKDGRNTYKVC